MQLILTSIDNTRVYIFDAWIIFDTSDFCWARVLRASYKISETGILHTDRISIKIASTAEHVFSFWTNKTNFRKNDQKKTTE